MVRKRKKTVKPVLAPKQAILNNKKPQIVGGSFLKSRYIILIGLLVLGFTGLIARAGMVQIVNSNTLMNEADKRSLRIETIPFIRGSILDRNEQLLSVSIPMYSIIADPKIIYDSNALMDKEKWVALASVLELPYKTVMKKIEQNPKARFVYLARQTSQTVADYINKLKLKGIILKMEARRFYPKVEETAHLVGYTNPDGEGIEGIEKSFNTLLIGKAGSRVYRKDGFGNVVENIADIKQYDAQNIMLSIDSQLQSVVYREIKKAVAEHNADSATAVLVDVNTGEILAMANAPSYNPNNRRNVKVEFMRNRAITDAFEPGSTIKPFVILAALQQGIVDKNTVLDVRPYRVNGYLIQDVSRLHSSLDLTGVLQKSSNVGVSHLALKMSPQVLIDTYRQAGLGKSTKLGLIGEQSGQLHANRKRWADIERATYSYGYGLTVTPLQLARAYATLGSFGIYRPLSITKVDPPVLGQRVYSEKITREVVKMMESVADKGGGGIAAAVQGYRVAVKTGTAKKLENGRYVDKYLAYTAGVAPATNPRFALVVLLDNPKGKQYYGGAISAPLFSSIMEYALRLNNIAPDDVSNNKTVKRSIKLSVENELQLN